MFFFSSRRRHTRSLCDWSSDVCSSDLLRCLRLHNQEAEHHLGRPNRLGENKLSHRLPDRGHRAGPHRPLRHFSRSEEHTSELQSHSDLVCRLLLEKKKKKNKTNLRCTN